MGLIGVVAVAVAVRVAHALLIRTSFSPDEYWQCLEVAHRLVFGCAFASSTLVPELLLHLSNCGAFRASNFHTVRPAARLRPLVFCRNQKHRRAGEQACTPSIGQTVVICDDCEALNKRIL